MSARDEAYDNARMRVSKTIREAMARKAMSDKELARRVKTNTGTVNNWMSGKNLPSRRKDAAIKRALGVDVEYLCQQSRCRRMAKPETITKQALKGRLASARKVLEAGLLNDDPIMLRYAIRAALRKLEVG